MSCHASPQVLTTLCFSSCELAWGKLGYQHSGHKFTSYVGPSLSLQDSAESSLTAVSDGRLPTWAPSAPLSQHSSPHPYSHGSHESHHRGSEGGGEAGGIIQAAGRAGRSRRSSMSELSHGSLETKQIQARIEQLERLANRDDERAAHTRRSRCLLYGI